MAGEGWRRRGGEGKGVRRGGKGEERGGEGRGGEGRGKIGWEGMRAEEGWEGKRTREMRRERQIMGGKGIEGKR